MAVEDLIIAIARQYGIPQDIALGLARRESGLRQDAIGPRGEIGIMQLMPSTARELGVDPYDTLQNIDGGLRYLRQQYDRFGDWGLALAAYNAGPSRVARGDIPVSTQNYVQDILGMPTFSVDVYAAPLEAPWWAVAVAAGALLWYLSGDSKPERSQVLKRA
jgi:soluble lytic murein transglycosylase-like protein